MTAGPGDRAASLTTLARIGFADLDGARSALLELDELGGARTAVTPDLFAVAADPDQALAQLVRLGRREPERLVRACGEPAVAARLVRVLGASEGLADFLVRRPEALDALTTPLVRPETADALRAAARDAVAGLRGEAARTALRTRYRTDLLRLAAWDLESADPARAIDQVAASLADLAAAALDAALLVAREDVIAGVPGARYARADVDAVRLSVIGMGKAGARELNYLSDVDVIFVVDGDEALLESGRAVTIGTALARTMMRIIDEAGAEPELWEVDANLRPEGKAGALVRTLDSHLAYYARWAQNWEFQALLKATPLAGDVELGRRYSAAIAPLVWASSERPGFVEQVQRMRERVTQHIPADEVDRQVKLGPGGLRDIEFTVQLLQLVHGRTDDRIRQTGTLAALEALAAHGYIGRAEAAEFAGDYRFLRLLEHRLQLRRLRRTHLMPTDPDGLRVLARAAGSGSAEQVVAAWRGVRGRVRGLHERLFHRPLLAAVARTGDDGFLLTSEQAGARLRAIGFVDADGALGHIRALTGGLSRRAAIQRTILPVLIGWFADGADPDAGLLAFRRLSERLGATPWYARMLRDSSVAAQRLTQVLSGSRFTAGLLDTLPEAAAWFEDDDELRPRPPEALRAEVTALVARHTDRDAFARALRTFRRREVLRLAIGGQLGLVAIEPLGKGLADVTTAVVAGALRSIRRDGGPWPEFAVIAMGRYGGSELGFGSDADVMYVTRQVVGMTAEAAQLKAQQIVAELQRITDDPRLPLDLDMDLRPEGRNGPVVRSLRSYEAYWARWSLTWESQALLRARGVAGDYDLVHDFIALADRVRYPETMTEEQARDIRRMKARVETERLPQGADPARHFKLGRGSLSDVEWLVQLMQLRHAAEFPALRTTSTLAALTALVDAGLIEASDAGRLRDAWLLATRARSALTLWSDRTTDILPTDRPQLEGVARLLEYPPGSASRFEEDYLRTTRRARAVFERLFYGEPQPTATPWRE